MNIFLTGATGLLGGEILIGLSAKKEVDKIYCLVRAGSAADATERIRDIFKLRNDHFDPNKVIAVPGDITDPRLLETLEHTPALKNINFVIHSAANTSFSRIHDDIVEKVNITGLNHMLLWAKKLKHLEKFVYVGTATICGQNIRHRVVREEESPDIHSKHFVKYTFTKMLGELAVHNELPESKILIVRPSIIMGDSRPIFPRSPVILWTLATANLMRLIPVNPNAALDIIPVDYAAEAIITLLFVKKNYNVYHISAGAESCTTPHKLSSAVAEYYPNRPAFKFVDKDVLDQMKKWAKKHTPVPPQLADKTDYLNYWDEVFGGNGRLRILLAGLEPYIKFMELGQIFDNSKLLADTHIAKSIPADIYIKNSVQYLEKIDVFEAALDP